ncbi:MAG: SRPBCC family protein [Micromonosporaceae bacterium]
MPPIVHEIQIDRPPDEVYAYATDPTRFHEWQYDVVNVRMEGGAPGVGAQFTTTRRIGPSERTMTQQITRVDPPRHWAVRGVDGPLRPSASITVEPLDDGARSKVTFTLDFEGHGVVGRPLVPLVTRMARKGAPLSHRHLKERLEAGV